MGADLNLAEDVAKETILKYLKMTHAQDCQFLSVADPPESPTEYKKLIAKRTTAREAGEKAARERQERKKARRDKA
jgi:hypothetical protein